MKKADFIKKYGQEAYDRYLASNRKWIANNIERCRLANKKYNETHKKTGTSGVYKITNKITGDCYIGSSKNIEARWKSHIQKSEWKRNPNPLYKDFQEYGLDNFSFEIIKECPIENLREEEQIAIDENNPIYNIARAKSDSVYRKNYFREKSHDYMMRPCNYNGETIGYSALASRFKKIGIEHPYTEASKFLVV